MRRLIYLCCLMVSFYSCTKSYHITGTSNISSIDGKKIALMTSVNNEWKVLDSCEVVHGLFCMRGKLDSTVISTLFLDGQPLMPVILEPGTMNITISNIELKVCGTPLNDELYDFIAQKNKLDNDVNELERTESQMIMNGVSAEEIHAHMDSTFQNLASSMEVLVRGFIRDNYCNVLSVCGFSMLCNGLPYPVITPLIKSVLDDAPESFKQKPMINEFVRSAYENMDKLGVASVLDN